VAGIQQAALDRVKKKKEDRQDFHFYIDEFQKFQVNSFNDILAESPKYKLYLTMAHQFMYQVPEETRHAVSGTVGTRISFQISPEDADKVKSIMTVNRTVWRKPGQDWEPMQTFKDFALVKIQAGLERYKSTGLLAGYEKLQREAQTAFTPTQLRAIARAYIDYVDNEEREHRHDVFKDIEIEQQEWPEKYELQNLPRYTAFARLGTNERVPHPDDQSPRSR
jgi:hypothetical protein